MFANSLNDLFADELKHAHYAEQQLVDALGELESQSSQEKIQSAFSEHRSETQEHVGRFEEVFGEIGEQPETKRVAQSMG